MVSGMVVGLILLGLLSQISNLVLFYLLWAVMGLAWGMSLYDMCFAYLIRVFGVSARGHITTVTLVAGFASTLSYPFNRWIAVEWSWEAALITQSILGLLIMVPLAWYGISMPERPQKLEADGRTNAHPSVFRSLIFLALAFALFGALHNGLLANFFPMMTAFGVAAGTATALSMLIGPMQVVGRVVLMVGGKAHFRMIHVTYACVAGMGVALCFLFSASLGLMTGGLLIAGIAAFLIFDGASYGVESIARPLTIAETLGSARIGAFSGVFALPSGLALAFVPALIAMGEDD